MSITGAVIGGLSGLGIRLFAVKFQKQRYLFQPWHIVLNVAIGTYIGYNYPSWVESAYNKMNDARTLTGHQKPPQPLPK